MTVGSAGVACLLAKVQNSHNTIATLKSTKFDFDFYTQEFTTTHNFNPKPGQSSENFWPGQNFTKTTFYRHFNNDYFNFILMIHIMSFNCF